jgi:hypothetical protein
VVTDPSAIAHLSDGLVFLLLIRRPSSRSGEFLAPGERRVLVAYSEFLAEVHAGHVEEIRIHEREVTFRVDDSSGRAVTKETIGPIPDQALVDSLKPDDPSVPLPKVHFEK